MTPVVPERCDACGRVGNLTAYTTGFRNGYQQALTDLQRRAQKQAQAKQGRDDEA